MNNYAPIPGTTFIGIGNKARHGKDTVAEAIVSRYSKAKRFAFGDQLKAHCRVVHGMTKKDGALLQRIGKEKRDEDPDVWIRALYHWVDEVRPRYAVVSDVRMRNELNFIHSVGGYTIRVVRYKDDGSLFVADDRPADDISEVDIDHAVFDFTIRNDRSAGDLMVAATEVFFNIDQSVQAAK
jgi:hypothetical protein